MNSSDITQLIADRTNLPRRIVNQGVNIFFQDIQRAVSRGNKVEIRGFGVFYLKQYEGYQGRNPRTGEAVKVLPKSMTRFKAGKDLRNRIFNLLPK